MEALLLLGRIVVATSFPPKLVRTNAGRPMEDYDRLCVQSWIACGFKIISLNAPDEIPALASRYPEVEFISYGAKRKRGVRAQDSFYCGSSVRACIANPRPSWAS